MIYLHYNEHHVATVKLQRVTGTPAIGQYRLRFEIDLDLTGR